MLLAKGVVFDQQVGVVGGFEQGHVWVRRGFAELAPVIVVPHPVGEAVLFDRCTASQQQHYDDPKTESIPDRCAFPRSPHDAHFAGCSPRLSFQAPSVLRCLITNRWSSGVSAVSTMRRSSGLSPVLMTRCRRAAGFVASN